MKNVIRLFLLLALSFQTVAASWTNPGTVHGISGSSPIFSLETRANSLSASESAAAEYMAHEADSMEIPCDLTENETWDSASDEGLRETMHFTLAMQRRIILLALSQQVYTYFIRYGIPPPELL